MLLDSPSSSQVGLVPKHRTTWAMKGPGSVYSSNPRPRDMVQLVFFLYSHLKTHPSQFSRLVQATSGVWTSARFAREAYVVNDM